jgi:hypothetical protein
MNIQDTINNLLTIDQQIKSIEDSINYINNRLSSYYHTQVEKNDIKRNVEHIKVLLTRKYIIDKLSADQIKSYRDSIHKGESVL